MTGLLEQGTLIVEAFKRFKDGSGRSSYYSVLPRPLGSGQAGEGLDF